MNLSLFGPPPEPATRQFLRERLSALSHEGIFIGTSSWKYAGWLGQIYTPDRYEVRGKLSQKRFEDNCLSEYAEVFPIVCGDFSFYQFPAPQYWQRLFVSAPPQLRFAFKVPEEVTVRIWPRHERYGVRAGLDNEAFLNTQLFRAGFAEPLLPYAHRVAALIFEFGSMPRFAVPDASAFLEKLDPFLGQLPPEFRYAVEIRNPEFLRSDYFSVLTRHRAAHVFNSWTRMPELSLQLTHPGAFTSDFSVVRALLRPGRQYEEAVRLFSPYQSIQDPYLEGRAALKQAVSHARSSRLPAFIFVNNRFEGNAPGTIESVLRDPD